ncbi:glycosyltransferase [Agromyces atrinae]|uniref:glycosyltransferase n=1 Tax=Agromyces atrinae TaxID=592376 RepID=UPI001F5786DD|nr:glycosyltransferase [Agromyces atrinae]MCI2957985.1 glycosyltransferase [Agromyces atrinae]
MTTLRVVVDSLLTPDSPALARYTADLTRALIATAPDDCDVAGIVAASTAAEIASVEERIPGLADLYRTTLPRREVMAAWQLGLGSSPGGGMIHSPSLFAPFRKHDRASGDQVVVTVHDLLAWTRTDLLPATVVAWQRASLKRARKHADAFVVPTHALAERLDDLAGVGSRIRVIPSAPRDGLAVTDDGDERRARLGLPSDYVAVTGPVDVVRTALDVAERRGVAIVALDAPQRTADEAGDETSGAIDPGPLDAADHAAVLAGARAFIAADRDDLSGTALIEAFALEVPVLHADTAALLEVAGEAGAAYADADSLAALLSAVVDDAEFTERLRVAGADRARAFSWRETAWRVWQLHADL